MRKVRKEFFREKIAKIPEAKRLYYTFSIIALSLVSIILVPILRLETDELNVIMEILLVFLMLYSFISTLTVVAKFSYHQESKLLIALLPGIMTLTGVALSFWIIYEGLYASLRESVTCWVITILAAAVVPFMSIVLDKHFKSVGNVYFLSIAQVIISGLIYWLLYSLC
ncbi:MAG: hypothetical protein ACOYL8_00480 [Patescibacteria group bacterium]